MDRGDLWSSQTTDGMGDLIWRAAAIPSLRAMPPSLDDDGRHRQGWRYHRVIIMRCGGVGPNVL